MQLTLMPSIERLDNVQRDVLYVIAVIPEMFRLDRARTLGIEPDEYLRERRALEKLGYVDLAGKVTGRGRQYLGKFEVELPN